MSHNVIFNDKKKALLSHKEKILEDIKYYDKRIQNFSASRKSMYFEDTDSADSDDEFPLSIDTGPSVIQLKLQQSMLRTCLQATQELTNLLVLQSEINIMVEDPVMEREPLVLEPGTWREVTAECRVDLVPFSITFYIHQPSRVFGQPSYRGLRVIPVKSAHETELAKSVLPGLARPSDAVEVLRSYAAAYRSRRTTLAELVDRFANSLFMEAIAEGGYILKCANLLEVSWRLENKWSPVAPFHHRLKFEIEYMDESYIQIITQAHKKLSDPSIDTNERTQLLSKIISTCLEAQGPTQKLYESMESDPESVKRLEKRRTTLDEQPDAAAIKKHKDSEVMAPPKSLPKKAKPKGKENENDNRKSETKAVKRANADNNEASSVKKAKISNKDKVDEAQSAKLTNKNTVNNKVSVADRGSNAKNTEIGINKPKKVASLPNSGKKVENTTKVINKDKLPKESIQDLVEKEITNDNGADVLKIAKDGVSSLNKAVNNIANSKVVQKSKSSVESKKNRIKSNQNPDKNKDIVTKNNTTNLKKPIEVEKKKVKNVATSKYDQAEEIDVGKKKTSEAIASNKTKNVVNVKNNLPGLGKNVENRGSKRKYINENTNTKSQLQAGKSSENKTNATQPIDLEKRKNITSLKNSQNSNDKKVKNAPGKGLQEKTKSTNFFNIKKIVTKEKTGNIANSNTIEKKISKANSVNAPKSKDRVPEIAEKNKNVTNINKINVPEKEVQPEDDLNSGNNIREVRKSTNKIVIKNLSHKNPTAKNKLPQTQSKPRISSANTEKEKQKISKIPQKKFSPIPEKILKKNPLRISPRKLPSKFKSPLESTINSQKAVHKTSTNIPRLLKKPTPKIMQT